MRSEWSFFVCSCLLLTKNLDSPSLVLYHNPDLNVPEPGPISIKSSPLWISPAVITKTGLFPGTLGEIYRENISLAEGIFAVFEVRDALPYDRPYQKAWSEKQAIAFLKEQSGIQFDPQILETFLDMIDES